MELYQGIILGILQGLTEFLPVSSSGHLVLGQNYFGIHEPALSFDISLHVGTLASVMVVFFKDIKDILFALTGLVKQLTSIETVMARIREDQQIRLALLIIIGSAPTAFLGLFFKKYAMALFSSIVLVGVMLLVTGTFLWFTKNIKKQGVGVDGFSIKNALFIGICQGLAVIPGISRSGATISAALFSGIERETAARFSFLLSLPAILGAEILSLKDSFETTGIALDGVTLFSTLVSFAVGYIALILLLKVVRQGRLYLFAPYCWVLGITAILLGLF